jgi:hypothetical protein
VEAPPRPGLAELLARRPDRHLPGRNWTKADLLFYRLGEEGWAVKSYGRRPFWIRHTLGRWLIRRECAAYRAAGELAGLPAFLGRLGPFALATEWIDARPLSERRGERVDEEVFERAAAALERLHDRGVALVDLHHRDLLVTPDGSVFFVDLAAAWRRSRRPGALGRRVFLRLTELDRAALARLRGRWTGRPVEADGSAAARWHARGRRIKNLLDRLRGKPRRRR